MPEKVIWFEDKLGITDGYLSIWSRLTLDSGFGQSTIIRRSAYTTLGVRGIELLVKKGNRKSPGFNPDESVQATISAWVKKEIDYFNPAICVATDPALGFLANPSWDQATIDNLRGGVYEIFGRPWVWTLPISAWHQKRSAKDIAKLNDGYANKQDWEERFKPDDSEEETDESENDSDVKSAVIWIDPVTVPEGKFVLSADIRKAGRILNQIIQQREKKQ